MKYHLSWKLQN